MIKIYKEGAYLIDNNQIVEDNSEAIDRIWASVGVNIKKEDAKKETIAYGILESHNEGSEEYLQLKFDSITSHDITYVGIIQTARASGMKSFPVPYVLTNCHNSLCAVGGTINEDDHKFALSAAKKYGGIYVPPNMAVIHSYNREMMAGCGKMILGSDSHTRYGALGTMAVGEGGGELAKQLLGQTYEMKRPEVVGVYLASSPAPGVGPQDISLAIIKEVFESGLVKNKVMEFVGEGIKNLPIEYRNGIDVMTTETTCWSSIWVTDEVVKDYLEIHERGGDFRPLAPGRVAFYDQLIYVDLSKIKPSIALPYHPSNVFTIEEFKANPIEILADMKKKAEGLFEGHAIDIDVDSILVDGKIQVHQGIIAGCAGGTFDNIVAAADILRGNSTGNDAFSLSVYPGSQPAYMELVKDGIVTELMESGVTVKSAFCGPCFGAGDTPANGEFSIRHVTRNFPNREGSRPGEGQYSLIALMDARSIAATARNNGVLTAADELNIDYRTLKYNFNSMIYKNRVYDGFKKENPQEELVFGPNIKDWPEMPELNDQLLIKVVSYITDPVTTTDELIPSGETSSYRSNPLRLAEFTLSRKDPNYVENAKKVQELEACRSEGKLLPQEILDLLQRLDKYDVSIEEIYIGSAIFANKPGDGSAREQAASSQKVLGAIANIAKEYATKRYRSNLINWGILPFTTSQEDSLEKGDYLFIQGIRRILKEGKSCVEAVVLKENGTELNIQLDLGQLSDRDRQILLKGSLINYNKSLMS